MSPTRTIRLVIADVDGTLLTREKVLTDRAIAAVRALKRNGVKLTITSGRPPRGLSVLLESLNIDVPIAAFNGGMYVRPNLSVIETLVIAPEVTASLVGIMEHHGLDVWIYRGIDWLVRRLDAPHVAREERTVRFPPTVVPAFSGLLDRVVKIVGVSDEDDAISRCLADVHERFPDRISAARSQPYYLDVTHPDANKGRVVERISELLGIPLAQVAVIGDMPNDVPMFRRAGLGIAMGQAGEEQREASL